MSRKQESETCWPSVPFQSQLHRAQCSRNRCWRDRDFRCRAPGPSPGPVRSFETFTEDLHRLKSWSNTCITTVAMESTGCTGFRSFQILEGRAWRCVW